MYRRPFGINLWVWAAAMLIVWLLHHKRIAFALLLIIALIVETHR